MAILLPWFLGIKVQMKRTRNVRHPVLYVSYYLRKRCTVILMVTGHHRKVINIYRSWSHWQHYNCAIFLIFEYLSRLCDYTSFGDEKPAHLKYDFCLKSFISMYHFFITLLKYVLYFQNSLQFYILKHANTVMCLEALSYQICKQYLCNFCP